ncbi:tryptophan 7-halogenase [Sphingomonas glacialis]|uniref:Uncharacterized protein n=1 Tax=Sphingomonas glacialis TaxID=658225 RepID=A0A502FB65_9SPHN|nr:tryptophan 7-halogenase [Sphingomonas glacialis]TPG46564.1 hypothetical protein EAH76_23410 [Sphingomonas glacialis]
MAWVCILQRAYRRRARQKTFHAWLGVEPGTIPTRCLAFEQGYRERQWIDNRAAVGLAAGFLEPLEATGTVVIEAAVAMIVEMLPHVA